MIEQLPVSQQLSTRSHNDTLALTAPLRYLSSADAGWEGLFAEAFYEPRELEGWMTPLLSDVSLVLFRGGAMRIEQRHVNGPWKALSVYQGDLSLRAGAGIPSEVRWKSLTAAPTQTLHLHLNKDLFDGVAEDVAGRDPARLSLVERSGIHDPLLTQIGLALWRELEQQSPAGNLYAQTAAQLLAVHLLRHYTHGADAITEFSGRLTQRQMQRVRDYVQAHLSQNLSLDALARQTGFSAYHFARLFRQTTGESPHQFVLRQRIEQAQRLLEAPDAPLADIALATGFANQSHFTQSFKRQLGLTPRAYRRERAIRANF